MGIAVLSVVRGLCIAVVVGLVLPMSAAAAPHDARVVAVFDLDACDADPCQVGRDRQLTSGATVDGSLQIHVAAEADLSLEWVRLEARYPGDARWWCLEFWTAGNVQRFSAVRTWITRRWTDPSQTCDAGTCSNCAENSAHRHGDFSDNIAHELRVVAHERGVATGATPAQDDESAPFTVRLANAPRAAVWIGTPRVVTRDGRHAVHLEWEPNQEPDIVEYHIIREDPGGAEAEFAVHATKPSAQGCNAVGDVALRCDDDGVPRAGGTVRYAIVAYRRAPAGAARCSLVATPCIASPLGPVRSVVIPAAPMPTATSSTTRAADPAPGPEVSPTLAPVTPSSGVTDQIAAARSPGAQGSALPVVALLALLLVGGAAVAARVRARNR